MFKFEKLTVWHKAIDFADQVYRLTERFPDQERFGLTSQMRRAGASIPSHVAEGCARSDPDFAKFVGYASGSLYEVVTQAVIAHRRGLLDEPQFRTLRADAEEISRMLSGLRDSLASRNSRTTLQPSDGSALDS